MAMEIKQDGDKVMIRVGKTWMEIVEPSEATEHRIVIHTNAALAGFQANPNHYAYPRQSESTEPNERNWQRIYLAPHEDYLAKL
jgi:hypothetical protein